MFHPGAAFCARVGVHGRRALGILSNPYFFRQPEVFGKGTIFTALLSCLPLGYYTVFYVPPEKRDKGRTPISSLLLALQNARYTYRGRRRPHASCGCPARFNELDCEFNMYFE